MSAATPNPRMQEMRQGMALLNEQDSCKSLLKTGRQQLLAMRFAIDDLEGVLQSFAPGVERTLKLCIGVSELSAGRPWPTNFKKDYGHGIVKLQAEFIRLAVAGRTKSTVPGLIATLLAEVEANERLAAFLNLLDAYGSQGRFHSLNVLAGHDPEDAPLELWEEIMQGVIAEQPDLLEGLGLPAPAWDAAKLRIHTAVLESIDLWAELVTRCWITGVLGKEASSRPFYVPGHA